MNGLVHFKVKLTQLGRCDSWTEIAENITHSLTHSLTQSGRLGWLGWNILSHLINSHSLEDTLVHFAKLHFGRIHFGTNSQAS